VNIDNLPPLPKPHWPDRGKDRQAGFTCEQMRDYASAAVRAALAQQQADLLLTDDDLREMRIEVRASPDAEHTAWWLLLCRAVERRVCAALAQQQTAVATEREACALVCEGLHDEWVDGSDYSGRPMLVKVRVTPAMCAAAIRSRGEK